MTPLDPAGTAVVAAVAFAAAFVQGVTGFGSALLAMPLLTLALGVRTAAPLVALLSLALNAVLLLPARASLPWRPAAPLLCGAALGIPAGVAFLAGADEGLVRAALGAVLVATAAVLGAGRLRLPPGPAAAVAAGGLSGLLGGAFTASGPPIVVYAAARGWTKGQAHATLQLHFLVSGLAIVLLHAGAGLTSRAVLAAAASGLPALAAGAAAGWAVHRRLSEDRFRLLVRIGILAAGIALLAPHAR